MIFPNPPRAEKVIRRVAAGITLTMVFSVFLSITLSYFRNGYLDNSLKWFVFIWFVGVIVMFAEGVAIARLKSDFTRLGVAVMLWFSGSFVLDSYDVSVFTNWFFDAFHPRRIQHFESPLLDYTTTLAAIVWGMTATRASTIEPLMKALKILVDPVKRFLKYERETRGIR